MYKAQDFKDGDILAGIDGKAAKIVDIRIKEVPGFGELPFLYVEVGSKLTSTYVEDGHENIEVDNVEVILWLPKDSADDDAKAKKIKGLNSTVSRLTKQDIDPTEEDAWTGMLEGGPLYDALVANGECYVKCNGYKEDKHNWQLEFNCDKPPKLTFDEYKKMKAKQKETAKKLAEKAAEKEKETGF